MLEALISLLGHQPLPVVYANSLGGPETPAVPAHPSRAVFRASSQVRRPSRPDPKTDGLDAWVHWLQEGNLDGSHEQR